MSVPLTEALEHVDLQPGKSYSCRVKDLWVEVRVRSAEPELAARFDESDVMLDPWVEFPDPAPVRISRPTLGPPDPPDIPFIPSDEDDA